MPKETFFNLKDKKQLRVIDAAIDEFSKQGFQQASVTNIIDKSDIASGSFYQYFSGKEDLFKYVVNKVFKRKMDYIDQEVIKDPTKLDFFDFLRKIYKGGIEFAKENPRLVSIGKDLMNSNCEVCKEIREDSKPESNVFFTNLLKNAVIRGDVKKEIDPQLTAQFLTSINYSLSDFIYTEDGLNDDIMEIIEVLISIIENGIKTKRGEK